MTRLGISVNGAWSAGRAWVYLYALATSLPALGVDAFETETEPSADSSHVPFSLALGYSKGSLPGAPGPTSQVAQSLYRFRLNLSIPLYTQVGLELGGDVLYPSSVKSLPGRVSSILRLAPAVSYHASWQLWEFMALEGVIRLGYAYEKSQYGSTALVVNSPRWSSEVRCGFPSLGVLGGIPGLMLGASVMGPFFQYSSSGDDTPLEVSGANVTLLSSTFSASGSGTRWDAFFGAEMAFPSDRSELNAGLVFTVERGRFKALRRVQGYRSSIEDSTLSLSDVSLQLSRSM